MLIYDIEIKKCIPPFRNQPRDPDLEYCEGWHDHIGMGVSCIGAFDIETQQYRMFMDDNMDEFKTLLRKKVEAQMYIIGFNSYNFDNEVIRANNLVECDPAFLDLYTYDILQEIWMAVNGNEDYVTTFDPKIHAGYGLDRICEDNLNIRKSGHGALAPVDFQKGRYGSLVDYCLNDVRMTVELFEFIHINLELKTKSGFISLREHNAFQQFADITMGGVR